MQNTSIRFELFWPIPFIIYTLQFFTSTQKFGRQYGWASFSAKTPNSQKLIWVTWNHYFFTTWTKHVHYLKAPPTWQKSFCKMSYPRPKNFNTQFQNVSHTLTQNSKMFHFLLWDQRHLLQTPLNPKADPCTKFSAKLNAHFSHVYAASTRKCRMLSQPLFLVIVAQSHSCHHIVTLCQSLGLTNTIYRDT